MSDNAEILEAKFKDLWKAQNKTSDKANSLDKDQALIAQSLTGHLLDCEAQHKANMDDRKIFKDDINLKFEDLAGDMDALTKAQTAQAESQLNLATTIANKKNIVETWCDGWSPRMRWITTMVLAGGILSYLGVSISDVISSLPIDLTTGATAP